MLCALIMAGGKGTRFWPLSTEEKPKQFLNLIGDETMIQMTVNRIKPIIPIERIFVCTGMRYVNLVREQLPELSERNIIIEPEGRNTAPCIMLSSLLIKRYYNDARMIVLPSDHLIRDTEEFINIVKDSSEFIKKNKNAIVTLGINPTRAETNYGYIKCSNSSEKVNKHNVVKVERFVEKPDKKKAKEYLENEYYLWNGGMFVWSADNIINQIKKYSNETYEALHGMLEVSEGKLQNYINENYINTESISIDYAVLENSDDIYVIPSDIGWDDVGSWEAFERYREKDALGNIHIGKVDCINGKNNLVVATEQKVVVNDLSNIYVIESNGKIIIGKKECILKTSI